MDMEYRYTKIDLNEWARGALFSHYMKHMRIVMSLTADIDVTPLVAFSKTRGLKFYPCMIWAVSKAVNAHDEFKYGWDSAGGLIRWSFISPSHTHFHHADETFTKHVTVFSEDLAEFHARFLAGREAHKAARGFVPGQPPNFFDVSCLPWVTYRHFDVHVFDEGRFLAPVVTWGKYEAHRGRCRMPLTMNIHHAVADGFHLCRFFTDVQALITSAFGA
ncbi:MAG: CatA-like O-acetyltransferase [Ruthenibacterium sp.]